MASEDLTPSQAHALLSVLTHHEVYDEIRDFRYPGTLTHYGPPFAIEPGSHSTSPSLQALLSKFILALPGLKNASQDFWQQKCASIIEHFEKANLSESYDKGTIGIRRTLATAISALIEYPVRGVYAGFNDTTEESKDRQYDLSRAEDLARSFRDLLHQMVYGNMIDEMFARTAETQELSEHPMVVQAAHEYILVNMASFLHYALILSPKGQYLVTMMDHANKLIPYTVIRQTLKIGNVASMINAMVKVVLAKMSMGSVTNWIGWTQGADEGMNLMQHIVSQVLHWDVRDMKSKITKLDKSKNGLDKSQLEALKSYANKPPEEQQMIRQESETQSKPIVNVILANTGQSTKLADQQIKVAQDYLATTLSIRDRDQIVEVLCHGKPDHLTEAVRDAVAAYEPIIRSVHNSVDLSDTFADFESFLKDLIKLAKIVPINAGPRGRSMASAFSSKSTPHPPATVGDFVQLLKKHQTASHKFLHQCTKNSKDVTTWFYDYTKHAAAQFKRDATAEEGPVSHASANKDHASAGNLAPALNELYQSLPDSSRQEILAILDQHALYLQKLHEASEQRLQAVINSPPSHHPALARNGSRSRSHSRATSPTLASGTGTPRKAKGTNAESDLGDSVAARLSAAKIDAGPGAYLSRWQALLSSVALTPGPRGPALVTAGMGSKAQSTAVTPAAETDNPDASYTFEEREQEQQETEDAFEDAREHVDEQGLREDEKVPRPDTKPVVDALGKRFRELLGERGCTW